MIIWDLFLLLIRYGPCGEVGYLSMTRTFRGECLRDVVDAKPLHDPESQIVAKQIYLQHCGALV